MLTFLIFTRVCVTPVNKKDSSQTVRGVEYDILSNYQRYDDITIGITYYQAKLL